MSQVNQAQIVEYLSILDSVFGKIPKESRDTLGPDGPDYSGDQSEPSSQHPDSLSMSFISRALVRHGTGDIAAVALPYDNLKRFYVLFANNRSAKDEAAELKTDSIHVSSLSAKLQEMYAAQLSFLHDPTKLEACKNAQSHELVAFILKSDAKKLLSRKLESTKYLGHFMEDSKQRDDVAKIAYNQLNSHITRWAKGDKKHDYEGLRRVLNVTDSQMSHEDLLRMAMKVLLETNHAESISTPSQFLRFVSFCRKLLEVPILNGKITVKVGDETALVLGKLQRRLSRIVTYESGAKAVTGSLFSYIRGVLNNDPLTLTPIIIPQVLHDEHVSLWKHTNDIATVLNSLRSKLKEILNENSKDKSKGKSKGASILRQTPKTIKLRPKNQWEKFSKLTPEPMIHAELRLIIYSLLRNLDISRVIGISKLPCLSCFCYLGNLQNALKKEMAKDVTWATSGCSWKPYSAWAIPMFTKESMLAIKRPDGIAITKEFLAGVASETQRELCRLAVIATCTTGTPRRASGSDSSVRGISDDEEEVGSGEGESVPSGSLQS